MKCEYCYRPNKAGREMCKSCGAPLPMPEQKDLSGGYVVWGDWMRAVDAQVRQLRAAPRPPRVPDDLETCKR